MKKCPSCGAINQDGAIACEKCYAPFELNGGNINLNNGESNDSSGFTNFDNGSNVNLNVDNESNGTMNYNVNVPQNNMQYNMQNNFKPAKSKKKKLIMGISALLILCIVGVVMAMNVFGIFMSPAEKVLEGLKNEMNDPSRNSSLTIALSGMENAGLPEIINKIGLKAESTRDDNNSYSKMAILLNNSPVVDFDVLLKDKDLFIGMGDKPLCVNLNEIMKSQTSSQNFFKGIEFGNILGKEYDKAILNELENKVKKVDGKYVVDMDLKSLIKMLDNTLEVAQNDKNIADKLYDVLQKIKQNAGKEKIDLGEEFNDIFQQPKDTVVNSIKSFISMARVALGQAQSNIPAELQVNIKMEMEVGAGNRIKNMNTNIGVQGMNISIMVDNTVKVKAKNYTKDNSTVVDANAADNEQVMAEVENYIVKAVDKVCSNPQVISEIDKSGILEDYKAMSGIDDAGQLINLLKETFIQEFKEGFREGIHNMP